MRSEDDALEQPLVPEREWWKRYSPVSTLPREIAPYFIRIKKRFGIDIANLVIFVYHTWGARVAKAFATKILSFSSFKEVVEFIERKASLFDAESRRYISATIFQYKYNYYFDRLLERIEVEEPKCRGVREVATKVFHLLARHGLFYDPGCIINYAKYVLGCANLDKKCRYIERLVKRLGGDV